MRLADRHAQSEDVSLMFRRLLPYWPIAYKETTAKPKRKPRGKPFPKGVSGNPGGRPKQVHELVALARGFSEEGLLKLADIMRSKDVPPNIVLAAINSLLDRGMGRPTQVTAAELSMLEKPRTGDDAKDITTGQRPVIIEQDPL